MNYAEFTINKRQYTIIGKLKLQFIIHLFTINNIIEHKEKNKIHFKSFITDLFFIEQTKQFYIRLNKTEKYLHTTFIPLKKKLKMK